MSQEESDLCSDSVWVEVPPRCRSDVDLCGGPLLELAPPGPLLSSAPDGAWIVTNDLFFFLFREFARLGRRLPALLLLPLRASLLPSIPPGLGKPAIWLMLALVCRLEVWGS